MNKILTLIAIACLTRNAYAQQQQQQQHSIARRQASQYCITPENYYGTCVTLSYCPQIANVFQTQPQRIAQRYIIASQRSCGIRSVNNDPVVCCTRPQTRPIQNVRPTQAPVSRQTNPFFQTQAPTRAPFVPPPPPTTTRRTTTTSSPFEETERPESIGNRASYCRGPDTLEGSCMAIEQCQRLVNELRSKPRDQEFANYLRASNRICGGSGTAVCCPTGNQAPTTARPTTAPYTNEVPRRLPTLEEGCGYTTNAYKKIVGGEVSKPGAWPWAALIGYDDDLSASPFKCGGTLVTARHVVTAAHCIRRDLTFVRLGEHDLSTDSEAKHVDVKVVRKEAHPKYNKNNGRNDIAILYLERNVHFSNTVAPICLPTSQSLRTKSYEGFTPFVVGWGKTMEGGRSSSVLQELQIPIFENQICRDAYKRQNRLKSQDQFDSAVLCAGVLTGGKDTCQGDSGGPLMIPEPYQKSFRFYLIGVVSYGIGCARPDVPGVYTSTQYFIDWIAEKVADS